MNPALEKVYLYAYRNRLWIVAIVFSTFFFIVFLRVATFHRQKDFTTFYFAVKAHDLGLNPYDTTALSSVAGREINRPFLYPPISLHVMKFFSLFEYDIAYQVFLLLKIAFLAGLIFIWGKYFCENITEQTVMLVLVAASFYRAVHRDFNAGNIAVFEQLFLWIGFAALLRTRYVIFAIFLTLGSLFKPLNLLALVPLAIVLGKQHWRLFAFILVLSAFLHGLSMLFDPGILFEFFQHAHLPDERGFMNPSSYAISRDIADAIHQVLNTQAPSAHLLIYGVFASVILLLCFPVMKKLDIQSGLMLSLVVSAIIAPRFKDYSYILLIVPSLFILTREHLSVGLRVISALIVCTHFVAYQSFIAALWLFGTYAYYALAGKDISPNSMAALPT